MGVNKMAGLSELENLAQQNMETRFRDNPCRGIVLGANENRHLMQFSWIMGRSGNSKNRVYVVEEDIVKTKPADPREVKDPRLIIYNAMRTAWPRDDMVVSNGKQTDRCCKYLAGRIESDLLFYNALLEYHCEPDPPIFTPRISGFQSLEVKSIIYMSILKADQAARERWLRAVEESGIKKEDFSNTDDYNRAIGRYCRLNHRRFPTVRQFFEIPSTKGYGYCLTTYKPGSKDLNSFEGEPFVVPIRGDVEEVMQYLWNHLEPEWRVSLAGKVAEGKRIRIAEPINRFESVG